jgi:hypothetical protein
MLFESLEDIQDNLYAFVFPPLRDASIGIGGSRLWRRCLALRLRE